MKRKGRGERKEGEKSDVYTAATACNHALSGGSNQPLRVTKGVERRGCAWRKPCASESIREEPPHQYSRVAICSRSLTLSPLRGAKAEEGREGGLRHPENRRPAPTGHHAANGY